MRGSKAMPRPAPNTNLYHTHRSKRVTNRRPRRRLAWPDFPQNPPRRRVTGVAGSGHELPFPSIGF